MKLLTQFQQEPLAPTPQPSVFTWFWWIEGIRDLHQCTPCFEFRYCCGLCLEPFPQRVSSSSSPHLQILRGYLLIKGFPDHLTGSQSSYSVSLQALSISFKILHYKLGIYLFIVAPWECNSTRARVDLLTAVLPAPKMMLGTRQSVLNEWHEGLVHPVIQFLLVPSWGLSRGPLCSHLVLTCSPSCLSAERASPSSSPLPSQPSFC